MPESIADSFARLLGPDAGGSAWSETFVLPFEALFAVRAALFGPIVVAQGPPPVGARERRLAGER
jgi:hypothetical protein